MTEQQTERMLTAIEQQAKATTQLVEMIAVMLESFAGDEEQQDEGLTHL